MSESDGNKIKWSSKLEFYVSLVGYSIGMPEFWRVPYLIFRNGGGTFVAAYILLMLVCGIPLYFLELALSQFSGKGPWRIWDICPLLRASPAYGVYISQLIRYDRACSNYEDFIARGQLLTTRLQHQGYTTPRLKSTFRKFFGRQHDIVGLYEKSASGIGIGIAVINGISSVNTAIMEAWSFEYFVNSFRSTLPWTTCDNSWNTEYCFSGSSSHNSTYQVYSNRTTSSLQNFSSVNRPLSGYHPVDAVDEFWLYRVLRISDGIDQIGTISGLFILYLFLMRLLAGLSMVKSVQSMGKLLMVTALLPVVLVIIIWIRALTLPGSVQGMKSFISPDWSRFGDMQLWVEASFQTFLTLGPGWGGLFMFGCHNKFNTNTWRASIVGAVSTLTFGLLNGLVVFSVLGVMATELGVPLDSVMTAGGFSITFIAYPKALSYFPFPQIWCVLFYLVMLMPGLDAMTILTEPFLLIIEEVFPRQLRDRRILLLTAVSVLMFIVGIPYATQSGVYMFLLVDWYTGTWSVMLICLAECIVFCWIYGGHRVDRDVRLMLGRGIPFPIRISSAFVMPIFMVVLLMVSIFTYSPPTFGKYSFPGYARGIGWCFASLSILPCIFYCLWIVRRTEGSIKERMRILLKTNTDWYPANKEAIHIYHETERNANKTFKEVFLFNLIGRGALNHKGVDVDNLNDIPLV